MGLVDVIHGLYHQFEFSADEIDDTFHGSPPQIPFLPPRIIEVLSITLTRMMKISN